MKTITTIIGKLVDTKKLAAYVKEKLNKELTFEERKEMYEYAISTKQKIGNKVFVSIPIKLLEVDESYQRENTLSMDKVNDLLHNWDENQMDPIKISLHPETFSAAIIDGTHRTIVYAINGIMYIIAVILEDLPKRPAMRRAEEARLFYTQDDNINRLSPAEKHPARVLNKIPSNVILDECIKGRKILVSKRILNNMTPEEKAKYADWKALTGFTAALHTAGLINGKETLNNILDIIEKSGTRENAYAYSHDLISCMRVVLRLHENSKDIVNALTVFLLNNDVRKFFSTAHAEFPDKKTIERNVIYMEREACKLLGIEPVYVGGDLRKVFKVNGTIEVSAQR